MGAKESRVLRLWKDLRKRQIKLERSEQSLAEGNCRNHGFWVSPNDRGRIGVHPFNLSIGLASEGGQS